MPSDRPIFDIDWPSLIGGQQVDPWQDDRQRKFARIDLTSKDLLALVDLLASQNALYQSSVLVLRELPTSAAYYVALAGFSQKTLRNSVAYAKATGLRKSPEAYVKAIASQSSRLTDSDVADFSAWINAEIRRLIPSAPSDPRFYLGAVAMVFGGRIIGQTQNEGGNLAVLSLKRVLLDQFGPASNWQVSGAEDEAEDLPLEAALDSPVWTYLPTSTLVDFRGGGNRPDIVIMDGSEVRLVGEVKGRKDLSNVWESWMPQLADHLRTWQSAYPNALRGALMTLITDEMIRGEGLAGVERMGLRTHVQEGRLHFVVNLSRLDEPENLSMLRRVMKSALRA
jgi:hypothetical protein